MGNEHQTDTRPPPNVVAVGSISDLTGFGPVSVPAIAETDRADYADNMVPVPIVIPASAETD